MEIPQHAGQAHLLTQGHIMGHALHAFNDGLHVFRNNQRSVEISGSSDGIVNFGVLDSANPSSVIQAYVLLTEPRNIRLVHIQLESTAQSNFIIHWSPFSFESWTGQLFPQVDRLVILGFNSSGWLGKFQDQLQFLFHDKDLNEFFIIVRDLVAVVGSEEDLRALAPIVPYVSGRNRSFRKPARKLEGTRSSSNNRKPSVKKLPPFAVPEEIRNLEHVRDPRTLNSVVRESLLPTELTSATYSQFWSVLLFVEELRLSKDLEQFNMTGEKLDYRAPHFTLSVPGVIDKRPSVLVGGKIGVRYHPQGETEYIGYVDKIVNTNLYLRLHPTFKNRGNQLYDVSFYLHRLSLRRMHQALSVGRNGDRLLFPLNTDAASLAIPPNLVVASIVPINRRIESNWPQKLAVASIVTRPPGSIPFIVFGPPGTGKTVVVIEAICQLFRNHSGARLLACAPSNSASDLLAERLQQHGITHSEMFRLNAPSRQVNSLAGGLKRCSRIEQGQFVVPELQELINFRVIITTCISAFVLYSLGMKADHFTHIFIDEAGQALEPEVMVPIRTLAGEKTNIVLSGDPRQLGPIVCSSVAAGLGCRISYLDRLMMRDVYQLDLWAGRTIVKLTKNFRSHVSILQYPNETFYEGELEVCGDPGITDSLSQWDQLVTPGFPIIFHAISGDEYREGSSTSFFNPHEVLVVRDYVRALRRHLGDDAIGVITPYYAQSGKIKKVINGHNTLKVGSVEVFQGQERQAIIISTVRSNVNFLSSDIRRSLGFVADPRRFNVAITRAQALLVVVGDPTVLSLDPIWRRFLDYIHVSGGWRGLEKDWPDDPELAGVNVNDFLQERRIGPRNAMEQLWGMAGEEEGGDALVGG